MAIKKPLAVLFLFILLFTLLMTVLGHSGILANRSLEARLDELERVREERQLQVEALQRQVDETSSLERLNDMALSLGYNRRGDVVYYFQDEDVIEPSTAGSSTSASAVELYEGVDAWILALISLGSTLAISLAVSLIRHLLTSPSERVEREKERARKEYEDFDW